MFQNKKNSWCVPRDLGHSNIESNEKSHLAFGGEEPLREIDTNV